MNVKELRAEASRLNIAGRSKMTGPELENAIRAVHDIAPVGKLNETIDGRTDLDSMRAKVEQTLGTVRIVQALRALNSKTYGMRGRGMGAKHYRPSLVYTNGGPVAKHYRPKPLGSKPDAHKPLSYADRVRHYAKQNGQSVTPADGFEGVLLLTPRQWRRAMRRQNPNRTFDTKTARY